MAKVKPEIQVGVIASIDALYDMQKQIKHCSKAFVTNYNIMPVEMKKHIANENVLYEFTEGKWLTILLKNVDFYRVYYFIADMENYRIDFDKADLVCELFSVDGAEGDPYNDELRLLASLGFDKRSSYHRWVCIDLPEFIDSDKFTDVSITHEPKRELIEEICQYFDKYSDYPPDMSEEGYNKFCGENRFVNLINKDDGEWVGVCVYPNTDRIVDWGFTLINAKYRGKGYGGYIRRLMLYECGKNNVKKCKTWIEDKNVSSMKMHERCGYKLTKDNKIVFLKRISN